MTRLCHLGFAQSRHASPKFTRLHFMQQELTETSQQAPQTNASHLSRSSSQHGSRCSQHGALDGVDELLGLRSQTSSPHSVRVGEGASSVNADQLDEQLRRLSHGSGSSNGRVRPAIPGQRISDYEKALTPSAPRESQGFTVIRQQDAPSNGVQLTDFPNG